MRYSAVPIKVCPQCNLTFEPNTIVCFRCCTLLMIRYDETPQIVTLAGNRFKNPTLVERGGSSIVLKAQDSMTEKCVAMKLLDEKRFGLRQLAKVKERFLREQNAVVALKEHENIVPLVCLSAADEEAMYIVTDFVDGINFSRVIGMLRKLKRDFFISIFAQVCSALEHAHEQGVIHCDLKPNDIILTEGANGTTLVKLIDFGKGSPLLHSDNMLQQLTDHGDLFGDPHYMSPEQCSNISIDRCSNVYSVGCMMFEALTGRRPIAGEHWAAVLIEKMTKQTPDIVQTDQLDREDPLLRVALKAMSHRREDRFQTAYDLKTELLRCEQMESVPQCDYSELPAQTFGT